MSNFNLKEMSLLEMTHSDVRETDGGIIFLVGVAVGMVAGYYMTKTLDEVTR